VIKQTCLLNKRVIIFLLPWVCRRNLEY